MDDCQRQRGLRRRSAWVGAASRALPAMVCATIGRGLLFALLICGVRSSLAQVYLPPPPPVVNMPALIWHQFTMNQIRTTALGSSMFLDSMIDDLQAATKDVGASAPAQIALRQAQTLGTASPATGPTTAGHAALGFTPSGHSLLAKEIAAGDPGQDAAQLERVFSELYRQYLGAFREENERLGMPLHDLAAAFTSYVVMSYLYANELPAIDAETSLAVYHQSAGLFLANDALASLQERDRELLAETFVVMGATPRLIFDETRDPVRRRQAAVENLQRLFGPDGASVRLTASGIVR